jgi:hypothetical protein
MRNAAAFATSPTSGACSMSPKIDDADDARLVVRRHQHVVEVISVVDHLRAQRRQARQNVLVNRAKARASARR